MAESLTRQQRRAQRRYGERVPGFTAVGNSRIDNMRAAAFAGFAAHGYDAPEAEKRAWQHVASLLPAARRVRDYSARPSKSDSAEYRKSFVRDLRK